MKNTYMLKYVSSRGYFSKIFLKLTAICLLLFSGHFAWGQVTSYGFTSGTGATLDPMASSTELLGSANDDGQSTVTLIGFTFNYAGTDYTQFSVNANGLLRLGLTQVTTSWSNSAANAGTASPAIMPYWDDLSTGSNGKVHYVLTGAAPNRKLIIEWIATVPRTSSYASTPANAKFQCILSETTNTIEFVYGAGMVANNNGYTIGLATSSTVYNTVNVSGNSNSSAAFKTDNTVAIPAGTSYLWIPPVPCSGTPEAGTIATLTQFICSGTTPAQIVATGFSTGVTGLTFQWEESNDNGVADAWANAVGGTGATTSAYTPPSFSGTPIYYRLKATCTNSSLMDYTPVALVSTPGSPLTSTSALNFTNVSTSSMTINWTNGSGNRRYVVVNTVNSFTPIANGQTGPGSAATAYAGGEQVVYEGTGTNVTITGLNCNTTYYVSVYEMQRCGSATPYDYYYNASPVQGSQETGPITVAGLPVNNDFVGFTGSNLATVFPGWYESAITTAAGTNPSQANPQGMASVWVASTAFMASQGYTTAKVNLYTNTTNAWIISPKMAIDVPTTLAFKAAITDFANGNADPGKMAIDDSVHVLVSTDGCGAVWTPIYTFTSANTTTLTNALIDYAFQLDDYIGETVQIAFQATDGPVSHEPTNDYDFHIGNVQIFETPPCVTPLNLTASATGYTTATISWSASSSNPTDGYEYEVRTSGAAGSGITGLVTSGTTAAGVLTKNITGLTANTAYMVYVRANCGLGAFSDWSLEASFTTSYCTPAPSSVDGDGIIEIEFGAMVNNTGAETDNYGDYSAMSGDMVIGESDTVKITLATAWPYTVKVWIDLNNDLDFNDAGENVFTGMSTSADTSTVDAVFTIPVGTAPGAYRMRIGGNDEDYGAVSSPCYSSAYGSFEDYTVNVLCPTTILAPTAPVGDIICATESAVLSITGVPGATLTWYDAAAAGTVVEANNDSLTTGALATTTSYWVEQAFPSCTGVSDRIEITATVAPVNLTLTPINNTCNGYAAGSFALGTVTCGTAPFEYSVDGGAFGAIPTDLVAGTYSIVVRDAAMELSEPISVVVGQPAAVIPAPTVTASDICVGSTTNIVTANTPVFLVQAPIVLSFDLDSQPAETQTAPGNVIASTTLSALPAGAVINSVTLSMPGITPNGGSWQSDVRIGVAGAVANAAAAGTGAASAGGVFTYTRVLPNSSVNTAGGTVDLLYWDSYNDVAAGPDATFTLGAGAATITIEYSIPDPNAVTWWTDATGGTLLGSTPSLETVGTSVLASPAAAGTYTFYAQTETGTCSSVTRSPLVVTVHALPVPTITAPSLEFCAGGDLTLTSSAATEYEWSTTDTTNPITVDAPGTYTVTVTDQFGCVGTSAAVVVVENALPTVDAGADQTVCENSSVTLAGSGTVTYAWDNGVTDNTPFTVTATADYVLTGTDANGCANTDTVTVNVNMNPVPVISGDLSFCFGDSTLLVASSETGNVWSTTLMNDSIYVDVAGTYTVTETDANGCIGTSAPVVVSVNALPTVNAGADIAVCQNGQAILFASGAQTYAWSGNITNGVSFVATATTDYVVTGTDVNGCSNNDTVTVTVNPLPTVDAGSNQTLCGAGQVTLTATGAAVYSWNNGVVNGTAFTAPVGTNVYIVTGIDALGCSNTDAVTVTVNALPVATATAANQLTIVASPAGMSYQWINCTTNAPILGANNQTFTADVNGSYKVIVTGMGGCADTSACVNITSVGLDEKTADLGITLYPNPTEGNVYVNMTSTEQANIIVYDAQGKVVSEMSNIQNGTIIDLNNVENGMYMIQVSNPTGSNIFRIVKN